MQLFYLCHNPYQTHADLFLVRVVLVLVDVNIRLGNIQLTKQSSAILISLYVTIVVVLFGLLNASFVLITFKNANTRKSGCGVYLLCSSILTYFTMFFFLFKFLIVLLSQIGTITDYLFLKIQCYAIDFLLRCSLTIGQWLTAFVAIERVPMS